MSEGNWVPMCKDLIRALPLGRPYSIIEAVLSYETDFNNGVTKSMREYSRIWQWPRHKVVALLNSENVSQPIFSQKSAKSRPLKVRLLNNIDGKVSQISAKSQPLSDHYYKNKEKEEEITDIPPTEKTPPEGKKRERKKPSLLQGKSLELFELFWDAYPKKIGIGAGEKAWLGAKVENVKFEIIMEALEKQKKTEVFKCEKKYMPHASTWLNQKRWLDEIDEVKPLDLWEKPL